jgi:phosphoribosyl 1,2-cyclic phosphate phosphodiesterase
MKVTILGCGSSGGVPLITGEWGKCDPRNPKNRRRRASILVQVQGINIVIDTGADFRQQLLDHPIDHLDAVLYTHGHADHVFGLDELRHFFFQGQKPIPIYASPETLATLRTDFSYAFKPSHLEQYHTFIEENVFPNAPFEVSGIQILPIKLDHTVMTSWGFRMGNFAYCTDFKRIEAQERLKLRNLEVLIIDCLMFDDHKTHVKFDETMEILQEIQPKRAILTHMNQYMDYEVALNRCPPGVEPGYDGLWVETEL